MYRISSGMLYRICVRAARLVPATAVGDDAPENQAPDEDPHGERGDPGPVPQVHDPAGLVRGVLRGGHPAALRSLCSSPRGAGRRGWPAQPGRPGGVDRAGRGPPRANATSGLPADLARRLSPGNGPRREQPYSLQSCRSPWDRHGRRGAPPRRHCPSRRCSGAFSPVLSATVPAPLGRPAGAGPGARVRAAGGTPAWAPRRRRGSRGGRCATGRRGAGARRRPPPAGRRARARATFEASVSRWNIDSPANSPPTATPYSPPTSSSSRQHSTECAQPSRCSRR